MFDGRCFCIFGSYWVFDCACNSYSNRNYSNDKNNRACYCNYLISFGQFALRSTLSFYWSLSNLKFTCLLLNIAFRHSLVIVLLSILIFLSYLAYFMHTFHQLQSSILFLYILIALRLFTNCSCNSLMIY